MLAWTALQNLTLFLWCTKKKKKKKITTIREISIEHGQLIKIPFEEQEHGDVAADLHWSVTSIEACLCSLTLPAAGRREGRGRSLTHPSSAPLRESLQAPGLLLLATCCRFDSFPPHPSQPRLSSVCFLTSRSLEGVQIPSFTTSPRVQERSAQQIGVTEPAAGWHWCCTALCRNLST